MALRTRPTQFPDLGSGVATEQITAASRLVSYLTGLRDPAQQGGRRRQRLRPRVGHPPGRRDQEPADLRDHDPAVGRAVRQPARRSASCRAGAACRASSRSSATRSRARRSTRSIARRSRSPTPRRRSPTRTCWRSSSSGPPRCRPASRSIGWSVTSSHGGNATGTVTLTIAGEERTPRRPATARSTRSSAPSTRRSSRSSAGTRCSTEYEIKAVSAGEDAQGQVLVRCRRSSDEGPGALVVVGHGLSTNIIEASLDAYLVAVNKLHGAEINGVAVAFVAPRSGAGASADGVAGP